MAHVFSGNGCKGDERTSPSAVRPKRPVGKEEALHMEIEALAKLQRDKTNTLQTPALSTKPLPNIRTSVTSFSQSEKDLIVFPESENKKKSEKDIDVEKLTKKELENLLLDSDFGKDKATRPSSLLSSKLGGSNPDGQTFSQSPVYWNVSLSAPLNSIIPSSSHPQICAFPSAFCKPTYSFQNGFPSAQPPFIYQATHQAPMLSFPAIRSTRPLNFQQPAVNPEMAKLFDKIASTSEYVKNGRSTSLDTESVSDCSLEPVTHLSDLSSTGHFDWLDLDPLGKNQIKINSPSTLDGAVTVESVTAGDPWDAVLQKETEQENLEPCSCSALGNCKCTATKKATTGISVTGSQSVASSQTSKSEQDSTESKDASTNPATLQGMSAQNQEIIDFCKEVAKLRSDFAFDDLSSNRGYALSQVISLPEGGGDNSSSVKVSIEISGSQQPVTFTCDVRSPVELLILQALCWVHDDLSQVEIDSYVLKVCGQEQVLQNKHSLGSHEYIQNCRKWEMEIKLQLLTHSSMRRDLARKEDDDTSPIDVEKYLDNVERPFKEVVTRDNLADHLERYHNHVTNCLQSGINTQQKCVDQLIQVVRKLCSSLGNVETAAITDAVMRLKHLVNLPRTRSPEVGSKPANSAHGRLSALEDHLAALTNAVYNLAQLYLHSFCSPVPDCISQKDGKDQRDCIEASSTTEHVRFTFFAIHGIPTAWLSSYEKYYLVSTLMHNGRNLLKPIQSKKVGTFKNFFYYIKWDELIQFPIAVASLPLETMLDITLHGVLNQNVNNSPDSNKPHKGPELLGKATMPLFDFRCILAQGTRLLSLWTPTSSGVSERKKTLAERILLQIVFPSTALNILYVDPKETNCFEPQTLEIPDPDIRKRVEKLCKQEFTFRVTQADKQLLWDWRHHCRKHEYSLPVILASVPSWEWGNITEIHALLHSWPPLSPVCALELLESRFADTAVRCMAVCWIKSCSDDELIDYLPQLVQALKFECHLKNDLTMFLLSRALGNVNIAHFLYWLLKDAVQEPVFAQRYSHVLGALLCLCGAGMRAELEKQSHLVQHLAALAEAVRQSSTSNRQLVLQEGLVKVQTFFKKDRCRLPLSPSLVAKDLNIKACSFFTSNAVPLKLVLLNADPLGEELNVMFKVGEDLRQDMLALQMIRIMDRIWLQEGLDLRVVNFKCISTGKDKGIVELVPSSETLRKIQIEYGVTGSFKDKPLAEWLRKYNPAEDEYAKASENFIYSCAGCCVATYLLGICDRHNDNIMLRTTGHMFHIDFGKFLGHAQMIGSFKRDRTPFVLTSDMAYVINGGERPTSRFQLFVDLCSQAYNLIRKHSKLFLNLLSLMTHSGLPELTGARDLKYVYDALQPQSTDAEATIFFTRLIESSLGSIATKFNFFIHNLAQLRFSGLPANDEPILSFSPRTYNFKQDGIIRDASIFSFQKRYNPDKHYTYVVRILREGQSDPQFVFRTFDEFQELHNKLSMVFPLWKLPGFPNKIVLGRTHVKDVASKRKTELNSYVHSLMSSSAEVAQCDLIYTFFHPVARDDKSEGQATIPEVPMSPSTGCIGGEVKLSISYRNGTLFIMVMHIKDLVSDDGADPNPYVKTYLLPDPYKTSKRKTKISRKTRNPTFNEMLVYSGYSKETLKQRELQLNVLSAESLRENCYLGGRTLSLNDFDLSQETVKWYKLTAGPELTSKYFN